MNIREIKNKAWNLIFNNKEVKQTTFMSLTVIPAIFYVIYAIISTHSKMDNNSSNYGSIFATLAGIAAALVTFYIYDKVTSEIDNHFESNVLAPYKKYSSYFGDIVILYLLMAVFTFFWTLLFIIPGLIKSYSYSQTINIYLEDMRSGEEKDRLINYITRSRNLMDGNKGTLFFMQLTQIGWYFLIGITFGVASFVLLPYLLASQAYFFEAVMEDYEYKN